MKNASETVKDFNSDCTTWNVSLISPFCGVQPQMNAEVQLSTLSVFFILTFGFGVIIMMLILWIWKIRVCSKLSPSKPGKMRNRSVDMHVHESIGLLVLYIDEACSWVRQLAI